MAQCGRERLRESRMNVEVSQVDVRTVEAGASPLYTCHLKLV
jgi:hypothetical protein